MYKKYTTPLPSYGMWGSRKTSWAGPANNNIKKLQPGPTVTLLIEQISDYECKRNDG